MKTAVTILLILILIFLIIAGYLLMRRLTHPKHRSYEQSKEEVREQGMYGDFDELEKDTFTVTSFDGYQLPVEYYPNGDSRKCVIICHGWGVNRFNGIKYLQLFRRMGYNAVLWDQRGQGTNPITTVTMGIKESKDLLVILQAVRERYGEQFFGFHGESLGAATVMMALADKPEIGFAIEDCGYGALAPVCLNKAQRDYHMPAVVVVIANLFCRIFAGYAMDKVRPLDVIRENEIPLCIMHGEADTFINCAHGKIIYEADRGYKELHLFPGAEHARSISSDPERYEAAVKGFLEKVEKL